MFHVYTIKIAIHLVIGAPPPIYSSIIIWFIDTPGFKVGNYLNITFVGAPYFIVGVGLGSVYSSSLNCYKYRSDSVKDSYEEQEFWMTRLDWFGIRLNQFEMFEEHVNCLSRWKQFCSSLKTVLNENHV